MSVLVSLSLRAATASIVCALLLTGCGQAEPVTVDGSVQDPQDQPELGSRVWTAEDARATYLESSTPEMKVSRPVDVDDGIYGWQAETGWFKEGDSELEFDVEPAACRSIVFFTPPGRSVSGVRGGGYLAGPTWVATVQDARQLNQRHSETQQPTGVYFFEFATPAAARQVHRELAQTAADCGSMTTTLRASAPAPITGVATVSELSVRDDSQMTFRGTDERGFVEQTETALGANILVVQMIAVLPDERPEGSPSLRDQAATLETVRVRLSE